MWTEQNTEGFSQEQLDTINIVIERIRADNDGLEESSLNDAISNEWRKGISEDELYEAVSKRLGIST